MRDYKFEGSRFDGVSIEAEEGSKAEENGAMSNISKHNSKQEGEGDCGEEGGIGFLVPGYTISLDNFLCWAGVWVYDVVGWEFVGVNSHDLARGYFHLLFDVLEQSLQLGYIFLLDVDFPLQEVVEEFHLVQLGVDLLLFHQVQFQVFILFEVGAFIGLCGKFVEELFNLGLGEG